MLILFIKNNKVKKLNKIIKICTTHSAKKKQEIPVSPDRVGVIKDSHQE